MHIGGIPGPHLAPHAGRHEKTVMPSFLPTQQPVVADLKSCEAWLARAALADARQACRELTGLLESLEEVSPH